MRLLITPSEIGSSPVKGSSYMMSIGSSAIARASATRARHAAGELGGHEPVRAAQAHGMELHQDEIADHALRESSVCSRIWNATLSNTVRSVKSAPNWNSMPMRRRSS